MQKAWIQATVVAFCVSLVSWTVARGAVPPADQLLPPSTKGFLSVPDAEALRQAWEQTQMGQLTADPAMQPFMDELKEQIRTRIAQTDQRLGISLEDLRGVVGGEVALAAVQPEENRESGAVALLVDVSGHRQEAQALIGKITDALTQNGATSSTQEIDGLTWKHFVHPRQEGEAEQHVYLVLENDLLVATDHQAVARHITQRLKDRLSDCLATTVPYQVTRAQVTRDGQEDGHIRWFVEPFGYAHVVRALAGGRKGRGKDLLQVLENQGFDAIRGVGGILRLATGKHELLHRTFVYAPPVKPAENESGEPARFRLAARMLDFPNTSAIQPPPWIPRDLATWVSFNWKTRQAFEYSKSLVNELMGAKEDQDLFEDILGSLATDRDGPQIDVRKELVAHLGERVTVLASTRLPVTVDSERIAVAVELTNEPVVRRTVRKAMEADPDAREHRFGDLVVWEIVNEPPPVEVDELNIGGLDFDPLAQPEEQPKEEKKPLPNLCVTVAHGHLIVGSHLDFVRQLGEGPHEPATLADCEDYQLVQRALEELGADQMSFRSFVRTDESYRVTYELLRQGKMPEAKTILGRLLNRLLGPEEEGVLRKQQIDGSKLPEFQLVRRYLGPGGLYARSTEDGWLVAGCLLSKDMTEVALKEDRPPAPEPR